MGTAAARPVRCATRRGRVRRRRAADRSTRMDRHRRGRCGSRDLRVVCRGRGAVRRRGCVGEITVGRGIFAPARGLDDVATRHGSFVACRTKDATPEAINYAVHERMTECEMRIAERTREATSDLIVLDGPLRKGQHITDAVGLVKTHHVRYLPDALNRVVGALDAGERTPVFRIDARPFSRHAWYLRLPGPPGGPWAGIVRCEANGTLPVAATSALADTVSVALPRFASVPHKDPRAPQNLAPDRCAGATAPAPVGRRPGVVSPRSALRARRASFPCLTFPRAGSVASPCSSGVGRRRFARRDKSGRMTDGLRSKGPPCLIRPLLPRSPRQPVTCSRSRKKRSKA